MYYGLYGGEPVPGRDPAYRPLSALLRVIAVARAADPDCCWFYERLGGQGCGGIGLWLNSVADAQQRSAERLRAESARRNLELTVECADRQVSYPAPGGRDARDELSAVSSDFALDTLTGRLPGPAPFDLAVKHMRGIASLVGEAERLPFLFQCWYHWSAALTSRVRVGCGMAARLRDDSVPQDTAPMAGASGWRDYLRAVSRTISAVPAASGAPANYLLFDHAHRTHRRLGVSLETEVLAVQVVRAEHAAGRSARGQDAVPRAGAVPLLDPT